VRVADSVRVENLAASMWLKALPESYDIRSLRKTSCNKPHLSEVFAVLTVPEAVFYPGEQMVRDYGEKCRDPAYGVAGRPLELTPQ